MDRRILVVDDDALIQTLLSQQLTDSQTEVRLTSDGESGIALAKRWKPELILLDVDMPGMSGHEVCRQLKLDPHTRDIPIIFLTAAASVAERVLGLDQGAVDYIAKPFDPFEVAARIRATFRSQSTLASIAATTLVDPLTKVGSRKAFDHHLQSELARSHRSTESLACILLEADQLQRISSTEGDIARDAVLCGVGEILKDACRVEDRVFRYTEHQFAVIVPNLSAIDLQPVGDRLRESIESHPKMRNREGPQITISMGLAISHLSFGTSVIEEAEAALAQARQRGGATSVTSAELTVSPIAA